MKKEDIEILQQIGLTNAQAVIYLALLEIGQCQVGKIIESTSLQSSVVHNNINKLVEKGLVTYIRIGKIKKYNAADPEIFDKLIEEKQKKLDYQQNVIKKNLPRLKLIRESSVRKANVEVFEGKRGFKSAYMQEYLGMPKRFTSYFITQPLEFEFDKDLHQVFLELDTIARDKKAVLRGIAPKDSRKLWDKIYKGKKTYQMAFSEEEFPWGIMVFKDTVLIALWGKSPFCISVKDDIFRKKAINYLNSKWKESKKKR